MVLTNNELVLARELAKKLKQLRKLKADKKALKQLVRELNKFVVHDACAGEDARGIDSSECDCGLDDAQVLYRRLMR